MTTNTMIKKTAEAIVGSLSNPSKMPCHGYSTPAIRCQIGQKMRSVKGSVCSFCYALKGRYVFPKVQAALEKRFQSLTHPLWVEMMTFLIAKTKDTFFRWHDSGDIQGTWHLNNIVKIAKNLPQVKFWLPTREYSMVSSYIEAGNTIPDNLTIRLSALMIDGNAPDAIAKKLGLVVSGVSKESSYNCPAPSQVNFCKDCRACWDKDTYAISYKKH